MKFASLRLCVFALTACALLCGCSLFKGTPNTVAYKVLGTTTVTAQEALSMWDGYLEQRQQAGKPVSANDERRVLRAYKRYQSANDLLIATGKTWAVAARDQAADVSIQQHLYEISLNTVTQAKADLFALLESFGIALATTP